MKLKDCEHRVYSRNKNYLVSEYGDVYSLINNRYLKAGRVKLGYHIYGIIDTIGDHSRTKYAHRLVAELWLENPEDLEQVNHLDEDTSNNHYSNLMWVTRKDNMDYSQSGLYYFKDPEGNSVEVFNLQKFCRDNNLSAGNMHMVLDGKRNHHKGWTSNLPDEYKFHKRDNPEHGDKSWGWKE